MKIDVLALNGVFDTGLAAVLDAFATANEIGGAQGLTSLAFDDIESRSNQARLFIREPDKGHR